MKKLPDIEKKAKISITVDKILLKNYQEHCRKNSYKFSSRLAILMEKDMKVKPFAVSDLLERNV